MEQERLAEIKKVWDEHRDKLQELNNMKWDPTKPFYYSMTWQDVQEVRELITYCEFALERERQLMRFIEEKNKIINSIQTDVKKLDLREVTQ